MIEKRLPVLSSQTRLSSGLMNHIIGRIEYAAQLILKYTPIGSLSVLVEKTAFGTSISTLKRIGGGTTVDNRGGLSGIGVGPGGMGFGPSGPGYGPGGSGGGPTLDDELTDSGYSYDPNTNTISNAPLNEPIETNPAMFGTPGATKTLTVVFNTGLPALDPNGNPYSIRYTLTINHAGQWFFGGAVSGFTEFKVGVTILQSVRSSTASAMITVRPLNWMTGGTVGFSLGAEPL